jgi:hypothetical protein
MDESEFNLYNGNMQMFKGKMNDLANSIEIVLELIFEKIGAKSQKMIGPKIRTFEAYKSTISIRYSGDFNELVDELRKFNENWVITKHGMTVGGRNELTIHKDGICYVFDEKKRLEIDQDFSQIMKNLIEISK